MYCYLLFEVSVIVRGLVFFLKKKVLKIVVNLVELRWEREIKIKEGFYFFIDVY